MTKIKQLSSIQGGQKVKSVKIDSELD